MSYHCHSVPVRATLAQYTEARLVAWTHWVQVLLSLQRGFFQGSLEISSLDPNPVLCTVCEELFEHLDQNFCHGTSRVQMR
jgi:hypothetical protein